MTYTEDKELKLYKFFADFFLPAGMLDYFELERMVESSPSRETIAKGAEYSRFLDSPSTELCICASFLLLYSFVFTKKSLNFALGT